MRKHASEPFPLGIPVAHAFGLRALAVGLDALTAAALRHLVVQGQSNLYRPMENLSHLRCAMLSDALPPSPAAAGEHARRTLAACGPNLIPCTCDAPAHASHAVPCVCIGLAVVSSSAHRFWCSAASLPEGATLLVRGQPLRDWPRLHTARKVRDCALLWPRSLSARASVSGSQALYMSLYI